MRTFFGSLFGTLVGLVLFFVLGGVLLIGGLALIGSMSETPVVVEDGSYLVLDLSTNITDAPPDQGFGALMAALSGDDDAPLQLRAVTRALRAAVDDERISGVFLTGMLQPQGYGSGLAALEEVRGALQAVRASGKPVYAYFDYATASELYLGSVAQDLVLDPYALVLMPGLRAEPMFYAGAFEKFGIGVQITKVGTFKSAVEPYTRTDFSPEARANLQELLDAQWQHLISGVATGRGLTPGAVQALVDAEGLIQPASALAAGVVTKLGYRDEVLEELKHRTDRQGDQTFKQVALGTYAKTLGTGEKGADIEAGGKRGKVAIVYAEGVILDGDFTQPGYIAGQRFARELRQVRLDESVDAIVLRVNSPGGSAIASEQIRREVELAAAVKPVVISMGSYAASGGYWIATGGKRIFADATTITGSIGVFGMHFNLEGLADKVGLSFDSVVTGERTGMFSVTQPRSARDLALLQSFTERTYADFLSRVSAARGITTEQVDAIGQGRVWQGEAALAAKLVDEIGGLDVAVHYAAEQAGVGGRYRVIEVPRVKELAEVISEAFGKLLPSSARAEATGPLAVAMRELHAEMETLMRLNDPRHVYAWLPFRLGGR